MLPTVQVPLVTQLLYDDAMVRLNNVGLDVVTIVRDVPLDSPTVGQVTDQQPTAYEEVEFGSTVTITVDQVPTVETPNVVGLDYQDAVAQLNLLGLAVAVALAPSASTPGRFTRSHLQPSRWSRRAQQSKSK